MQSVTVGFMQSNVGLANSPSWQTTQLMDPWMSNDCNSVRPGDDGVKADVEVNVIGG